MNYSTEKNQVEKIAKVMSEVFELMTADRRKERLAQGVEYVTSNTTSFWAATILTDLKAVGRSADRSILAPVGLGLNFRMIGGLSTHPAVGKMAWIVSRGGYLEWYPVFRGGCGSGMVDTNRVKEDEGPYCVITIIPMDGLTPFGWGVFNIQIYCKKIAK